MAKNHPSTATRRTQFQVEQGECGGDLGDKSMKTSLSALRTVKSCVSGVICAVFGIIFILGRVCNNSKLSADQWLKGNPGEQTESVLSSGCCCCKASRAKDVDSRRCQKERPVRPYLTLLSCTGWCGRLGPRFPEADPLGKEP